MKKFASKAAEIFDKYSQKDTLYFTSDGQPFFETNPAENHAKGLEDESIETIERSEVSGDIKADGTIADSYSDQVKKTNKAAKAKSKAKPAKGKADAQATAQAAALQTDSNTDTSAEQQQ